MHLSAKVPYIDITDAKTAAGAREVTVHKLLMPTMKARVKDRTDGYVLSDLTENKCGDLSNAIGKRFGRLKKDLGVGPELVFQSIRKTVSTLLENSGVSENVAANILGHVKSRITSGLYSGGLRLR